MYDSLRPYRAYLTILLCQWDSSNNNIGRGCHTLLQGIFPTRSNPCLLHLLHWQVGALLLAPYGKPNQGIILKNPFLNLQVQQMYINNLVEGTVPVQYSSVAQLYLTHCDPMDCSTPGCLSLTPGVCSNSCLSSW